MIKQEMIEAINNQIQKEMFSSNLYLSMAAYYDEKNLNGFAHWMRIQAQEEMTHALKFFDHLLSRGGKPIIKEIPAPKTTWESTLAVFEEALAHERMITDSINQLADLSIKLGDHASHVLLQWFITEQVEEESQTEEILDRLRLTHEAPGGLFILDSELKGRQLIAE